MREIIFKEIRQLLYSPSFIVLALASLVMILLAIGNGYASYLAELETAQAVEQKLAADQEKQRPNVVQYSTEVFRFPSKLSIFDSGISYMLGRHVTSSRDISIRTQNSRSNEHPVIAMFGFFDLTFVVVTVLSLFAVLLGFGAISGERQDGSLRQIMATSIRRPAVISGKYIGIAIPLLLTFIIPFIIGLFALLVMTGISLTGGEWLRIVLMAAGFCLYLLAFLSIAVCMSTLTRTRFMSFMLSLVIWVLCIGVLPRFSIYIGNSLSPIQKQSEIRWQLAGDKLSSGSYEKFLKEYLDEHDLTPDEYRLKRGEIMRAHREKQQAERNEINAKAEAEYMRQRRNQYESILSLARLSPSTCVSMTTQRLAGTGSRLFDLVHDNVLQYSREFLMFVEAKREQYVKNMRKTPRQRQSPYVFDESGRLVEYHPDAMTGDTLDMSGRPQWHMEMPGFAEYAPDVFTSFGFLAAYALVFFAIAYVAFMRYDVR